MPSKCRYCLAYNPRRTPSVLALFYDHGSLRPNHLTLMSFPYMLAPLLKMGFRRSDSFYGFSTGLGSCVLNVSLVHNFEGVWRSLRPRDFAFESAVSDSFFASGKPNDKRNASSAASRGPVSVTTVSRSPCSLRAALRFAFRPVAAACDRTTQCSNFGAARTKVSKESRSVGKDIPPM
jgi:hypothetical protein